MESEKYFSGFMDFLIVEYENVLMMEREVPKWAH